MKTVTIRNTKSRTQKVRSLSLSGWIGSDLASVSDAFCDYCGRSIIVWYCDKVGSKNGAKECPDGGAHNSTYDAVILEKVYRSRALSSYADVTRKDVNTPLGKNRLIIS